MNSLSYDEALSALQQLEERDKMTPFHVGDIVAGVVVAAGGNPANTCKRLASDLGRSLSWVEQRRLVADAFPMVGNVELEVSGREELWGGSEPPPPVTWVHHRIIAFAFSTPELRYQWLAKAIDKQWSTRQLQEAINGEKPDATSDIIITHDQVHGEIHVRLSEDVARHVRGSSTPGVLTVEDAGGATTAIHVRLPASALGRKARLRRTK